MGRKSRLRMRPAGREFETPWFRVRADDCVVLYQLHILAHTALFRLYFKGFSLHNAQMKENIWNITIKKIKSHQLDCNSFFSLLLFGFQICPASKWFCRCLYLTRRLLLCQTFTGRRHTSSRVAWISRWKCGSVADWCFGYDERSVSSWWLCMPAASLCVNLFGRQSVYGTLLCASCHLLRAIHYCGRNNSTSVTLLIL